MSNQAQPAAASASAHSLPLPPHRIHLAPGGDDRSGTGQADRPFRSLHRAQEAVRALIAAGLDRDVEVRLRGGSYLMDRTLVMDERDSGRDCFTITWCNADGEEPIIDGGTLVQGWKPHQGGIWKAQLAWPSTCCTKAACAA
jgi:hypothetical protein